MAEETFLTVAEVATKLRVSKMTVYRLVWDGQLPAVKIGRSVRIWRTSLEKLVRAGVAE